ncbi:MAG: flagellar hook-associated protein FlgK [Burkholderiaceae bacterium]
MSVLSVGQSALMAAYAQLQVTGHNIANANTVGYSRQEAVLSTAGGQFSGSGFLGMGVDVLTVRRNYDRYLTNDLMASTAQSNADRTRATLLSRLDDLLADTDNGIGVAIDNLNLALADVANNPGDASARQAVLSRAEGLAQRLRGLDQQLQQIGRETNERLLQSAGTVNGLLERIARLNDQISYNSGAGQTPNDLLDQRDQLVLELNQHLKVSTFPQSDGSLTVITAGGEGLVVGGRASRLETQPDPLDSSKQQLVLVNGPTRLPMDAQSLGGGTLAGALQFRDGDLEAMRARLGQLSAGLAASFNEQQALGVDATGTAGAAMFRLGAVQVNASSKNLGSATLQATIVDGKQLDASDLRVSYDSGQYVVTRVSDGVSQTFASLPQTVGGVRLEFTGTGTMAPGDSFLVRSASSLSAGFTQALSSGSQLATGYAMTSQLGSSNAGSVAVSGFSVGSVDPNLTQPVTITFDGSGGFSVTGTGTGNPTGVPYSDGMTVSYNGWSITLRGAPQAGDTVQIVPTANPAQDNRNAKAMIGLADQPNVSGATFNQAFATMLSDVGMRTQSAQGSADVSDAMLSRATAAHSAQSGVNLDEEAARLMQFQQMYQAAAKVIQAAQDMFDTLLAAATGR